MFSGAGDYPAAFKGSRLGLPVRWQLVHYLVTASWDIAVTTQSLAD